MVGVARAVVLCAAACGCGRIGFDPSATGDGAGIDTSVTGAGSAETCATARDLSIGANLVAESIANATNDVPALGSPDGPELVFRIQRPGGNALLIQLRATFNGGYSRDTMCPPTLGGGSASGSYAPASTINHNVPAGTSTIYFIVDKTTGAGSTFDLSVN